MEFRTAGEVDLEAAERDVEIIVGDIQIARCAACVLFQYALDGATRVIHEGFGHDQCGVAVGGAYLRALEKFRVAVNPSDVVILLTRDRVCPILRKKLPDIVSITLIFRAWIADSDDYHIVNNSMKSATVREGRV